MLVSVQCRRYGFSVFQFQGEWEVQDKKKRRANTVKSEKESVAVAVQEGDRGDSKPDRSRDRYDHDRHDAPPR